MTWFKVDDKHHDHKKTRKALRGARGKRRDAGAVGLWELAGSWSADNLMDGFVPTDELFRWDDDWEALAERLVDAGFWEHSEHDGEPGFQFVNWEDHQPMKAEVEAKREAAKERMRQIRSGSRSRSKEVRANEQENLPRSSPTPSRPVPTRPKDSKSEAAGPDEPREEIVRLCELMARRLKENGAKNVSVGEAWHTAARLMLDKDGYTEQQIAWLIDKTADDEFWRANVLSMPTLRAKADQLRMKFLGSSNVRQLRTDDQGQQILPPPPGKSPWSAL